MKAIGYRPTRRAIVLSLIALLTLAVALLWLSTYRASGWIMQFESGARWNVRSWKGRVWIEWSRQTLFVPTPRGWYLPEIDSKITVSPDPIFFSEVIGFAAGSFPPNGLGPHVLHVLMIPHWFLLFLGTMIGLMLVLPAVKAAKLTHCGLCPACGYDLRVTPERCPECGRESNRML